jgi:hypothetical protein
MDPYSVPGIDSSVTTATTQGASSFGSGVLWLLLAVAVVLYVIFGLIVAYHFFRYARNPQIATTTTIIYAAVGVVLTLVMIAALSVLS